MASRWPYVSLLREAINVHRTGTVDERRRWVLRRPTSSSAVVSALATILVVAIGRLVRPDAVTLPAVLALFGATFGAALLLLALAGRRA